MAKTDDISAVRSWIARYWALGRHTLLGGIYRSHSSRWGSEQDAHDYLATVIENNGGLVHCDGEVVESKLSPEIFRHCGDASRPAQAVGGKCFSCGKVLTKQDAFEHVPQPIPNTSTSLARQAYREALGGP